MNKEIPAEVAAHLSELVKSSDEVWAREEGALDKLRNLWQDKQRLFTEQIELMGMEFIDSAAADDPRGMILITFSGSLVALGPGVERKFAYASIKMRSDVPDILNAENSTVTDTVKVGVGASFDGAPVKKTSAIYRIAAVPASLSFDEQESRIREAMVFLTASFVHLNRHFTMAGETGPGQFDKKSVVKYLAENNDLSQKVVRRLIDDYAVLLETGMLMGNTVAIGQLGRLSLKLQPVRKARVGRNPSTGGEMIIPAKPAHMVPVFKFSSRAKERTATLPVPGDD